MALALLGTEGWNVEEKCLGIKLEEEEQEDVVNDEKLLREFLLNSDIKNFGSQSLATLFDGPNRELRTPIVLQLSSWRNISHLSVSHQDANSGVYLIKLTDGHQTIKGFAFEPIFKLDGNTPAGTKLLLEGKIKMELGMLMLNNKNATVLGGKVDHLVEQWKLEKIAAKTNPDISIVIPWLPFKYQNLDVFQNWIKQWINHAPECDPFFRDYIEKLLITELTKHAFEIFVADYPMTIELVKSLRFLMVSRDWYGREKLLTTLSATIADRLLNIGVPTRDILKAYACSVDSLIAFDESYVLVHKACDLIKKYVKTRPDTVRTIIHFINFEKPGMYSDTVAQIIDKDNLTNVSDEYVIMKEDAEKKRFEQWNPDPYDANPAESRLFRESADVFNMLVSIYGSRDLFVKEYQRLLANSLVARGWGDHNDAEQKYLETMKKRFTDGELSQCEVMLRDIGESEKLFKHLLRGGMRIPFLPRIVSSVFWPEVKRDQTFKIVEPFKGYMELYKEKYEAKRTKRTINWYNDYGSCIKMDIKLKDCVLSVEAPLSFTQVLLEFLKQERITVEELMNTLDLDRTHITKRLEYWQEMGVLIPVKDAEEPAWEISKSTTQMSRAAHQARKRIQLGDHIDSDDDEEEEVPVEVQINNLEEFWPFTRNMLLFHSKSGPITPLRLQNLFKALITEGPMPTIEIVMSFMQRKINLNLVTFENGCYRPDKDLKTAM